MRRGNTRPHLLCGAARRACYLGHNFTCRICRSPPQSCGDGETSAEQLSSIRTFSSCIFFSQAKNLSSLLLQLQPLLPSDGFLSEILRCSLPSPSLSLLAPPRPRPPSARPFVPPSVFDHIMIYPRATLLKFCHDMQPVARTKFRGNVIAQKWESSFSLSFA